MPRPRRAVTVERETDVDEEVEWDESRWKVGRGMGESVVGKVSLPRSELEHERRSDAPP